MANSTFWILLDEIITDYLDSSEQSLNKYSKCFNLAFRVMDSLGMDFFYKIQSVKLPVLANLTVPLPANYINYSKVGVFNDRGEVIPLFQNDKLTTYADLLPNRNQVTQDNTLFDFPAWQFNVFCNYWNGYAGITNLYGVPSGEPFVGSYKIDNSNGVILLNEYFTYPYIVLEYVASPQEGQPYSVPRQFREAIIAYLAWQDIASVPAKTHVMNNNVAMRRRDYFNARRLALAQWKPWDLADSYERALRDQRLSVKA